MPGTTKLIVFYSLVICGLLLLFFPVWYDPLKLGLFHQDEQKIVAAIWNEDESVNINDPTIFYLYSNIVSHDKLTLLLPLIINLLLILIQTYLIFNIVGIKRITFGFLFATLPLQQFAYIYGPTKDIWVATALIYFLYLTSKEKLSILWGLFCVVTVALFKALYLIFFPVIYFIISQSNLLRKFFIGLLLFIVGIAVLYFDLRGVSGGYSLGIDALLSYLSLDYQKIYGDAYEEFGHVTFPTKVVSYIIGPLQSVIWPDDPYYRYQHFVSQIAALKITIMFLIIISYLIHGRLSWPYFFLSAVTLFIISFFYFGVNYRYRILFEIFFGLCFVFSSLNKRPPTLIKN